MTTAAGRQARTGWVAEGRRPVTRRSDATERGRGADEGGRVWSGAPRLAWRCLLSTVVLRRPAAHFALAARTAPATTPPPPPPPPSLVRPPGTSCARPSGRPARRAPRASPVPSWPSRASRSTPGRGHPPAPNRRPSRPGPWPLPSPACWPAPARERPSSARQSRPTPTGRRARRRPRRPGSHRRRRRKRQRPRLD